MDTAFMKSFYKNYYDNPQHETVKKSQAYIEKRIQRYELEKELEFRICEEGEEFFRLFEAYLDACVDELEVLLLEMYLIGAQDRKKMLRGII